MCKEIDYSVIIRTTGKAGQKYKRLLDSITNLIPAPKEVIVVLPDGYDLPKDQIGNETFYFCPKGMVKQRLVGIENCKTEYALITDDDIAFKSDFIQKLYKPIQENKCNISIGPLLSFLPQTKKQVILSTIMGAAVPTIFHKERYNSILRTAGYSYNRQINLKEEKYYETQSAAWTCFFANIPKLKSIRFEDEMIWLDKNGYSALDDSAMFYKAWLMGIKTIVVSDAIYEHLDARTSTKNNAPATLYSTTFNCIIFWHRFIYLLQKNRFLKCVSRIAIFYRMIWIKLWNIVFVLTKRMTMADYKISKQGCQDGWRYIHSKEYKSLSDIKMENKRK